MLINLNIEASFVNIFRPFRANFTSSTSNLIDISVNCNTRIDSTEFFCSLYVDDSSSDDSVNIFCNVNSNMIFNDTRFSHNQIVSKNHLQSFYYSNDEKVQSHKLQEFALSEFILNSAFFSLINSLNYYIQTISLSSKNCFLHNVFIA